MGISCMMGHKPIFNTETQQEECERCGLALSAPKKELQEIKKIVQQPQEEEDELADYDEPEEEEQPKPKPQRISMKPKPQRISMKPKPQKEEPVQAADILASAIEHYGIPAQAIQTVEELSELSKQICKALNGSEDTLKIAEEIADVEIMLAQIKLIYQNPEQVQQFVEQKLQRLYARLQEETKHEKQ